MTDVLLISDTERVQRVFAELETRGVLQLRAAATLAEVDQELTASPPEITFVQTRISGFSGEILLRHLKRTLPERARLVLLAADSADVAQAGQSGLPCIDLTREDEAVSGAVAGMVTGSGLPAPGTGADARAGFSGKAGETARGAARKKAPVQEKAVAARKVAAEKPRPPESAPAAAVLPSDAPPVAGEAAAPAGASQEVAPTAPRRRRARSAPPGAPPEAPAEKQSTETRIPPEPQKEAPPAAAAQEGARSEEPAVAAAEGEAPAGEAVREWPLVTGGVAVAQEGAGGGEPAVAAAQDESRSEESAMPMPVEPPAREDGMRGAAGAAARSFEEMIQRASERRETGEAFDVVDQVVIATRVPGPVVPSAPSEAAGRSRVDLEEPAPPPVEDLLNAESFGQAMLPAGKKGSGLKWIVFGLLLALFLIPVAGYILGRKAAPPEQAALQEEGVRLAERPVQLPPVTPALAPPAGPALQAAPAPEGAAPADLPPQAGKAGLAALPPFLEGVQQDPDYGASHPGWERYLGARAEYKVFREGERYRAIQAIPKGEQLPEPLVRRVLKEFGGIESYWVESTEQKGDYLVEHGGGAGSVGLTVYRKKNDPGIKALVVYYR